MNGLLLAALAWCGGVGCAGIGMLFFRRNVLAALGLSALTMLFGIATLYMLLR